ncbi:hypothetical protein PV350_33515 [Streptomyces sp. PA03-6a]|nr:hypothetical protein [Streptomyces sp. PA03-6a]
MAVPQLHFVAGSFVNFRDHAFQDAGGHAFRWVSLKAFRFPPGAGDRELLGALIAHEQFRDDYAGGDVEPDGTRHGPYRLDRISPGAYRPVAPADAIRTLRGWAARYGRVPTSLEAVLEERVHRVIGPGTACHRLADLGRDAFHDWGGVHCAFHEYVVVDHAHAALTLLVAADD